MSQLLVVGLDLSLTSTGIAGIWQGHRDIWTRRIQSIGAKDAALRLRQKRLSQLARDIVDQAAGADLVVIEGPSLGQLRQVGQHDRSGLWWLVVDMLTDEYGCSIVEVPPATRSKYATGKGNAPKDQVLAATVKRYPTVDVTGNDIADALILAAMGARHLGYPIEPSLPAAHLDAMAKIRWPERTSQP